MGRPAVSEAGNVYGRLSVLRRDETCEGKHAMWVCLCECGATVSVAGGKLRSGWTRSCGCYKAEVTKTKSVTHGMRRSPEYGIWRTMITRCTNQNNQGYKYYGARGITVAREWLRFENFLADMGLRPSVDHSLDREDNSKGYSKDNCRWATRSQQARNKKVSERSTTGVAGVTRVGAKYRATIRRGARSVHLGMYFSLEAASAARRAAEEILWKE